jgi:uncharacterized membrane protein YjjB (DUF3815 family)
MKGPFFAAAATSGFSVLFGLHSIDIILASGGAAIGWAVFQTMPSALSPAFAAFAAALAAGFFSEIVGWFRSRPATVYMIASIIPLVPGSGMYYTMLSTLGGDSARSVELGLATMITAFAIAAGLAVSNAFGRMAFGKSSRIPRQGKKQ